MAVWLGRVILVAAIVAVLTWLVLSRNHHSTEATFGGAGDMTTESAVIGALEETPYEIRYRKVPRVEGYEVVAGRARSRGGGVVDFSVVLRKGGEIESSPEGRLGGSAQFPVIRYFESAGSITGNMNFVSQPQGHLVVRKPRRSELAWVPTREETKMSIQLGLAVEGLFAPNVDPGP